MPERLMIPGDELSGPLRAGAVQHILADLPDGHAHGSEIVIDAVAITYRIRPAHVSPPRTPWGLSENVRIIPEHKTPGCTIPGCSHDHEYI